MVLGAASVTVNHVQHAVRRTSGAMIRGSILVARFRCRVQASFKLRRNVDTYKI